MNNIEATKNTQQRKCERFNLKQFELMAQFFFRLPFRQNREIAAKILVETCDES